MSHETNIAALLDYLNRSDLTAEELRDAVDRAGRTLPDESIDLLIEMRPYSSADDVLAVPTIGPQRLETLLALVGGEAGGEASSGEDATEAQAADNATSDDSTGDGNAAAGGDSEDEPTDAAEETEETPPTPEEIAAQEIRALMIHLKDTCEHQEWGQLAELFPFPSIWVQDRAVPVDEVIAGLQEAFSAAQDVEWQLLQVPNHEVREDHGQLSFHLKMLWSDQNTWAEHAVPFQLHTGLRRQEDGTWCFEYCGLTAAPTEDSTDPESAPSYFGAEAETGPSYFATAGAADSSYFASGESAGSYFAASPETDESYFAASPETDASYFAASPEAEGSYFAEPTEGADASYFDAQPEGAGSYFADSPEATDAGYFAARSEAPGSYFAGSAEGADSSYFAARQGAGDYFAARTQGGAGYFANEPESYFGASESYFDSQPDNLSGYFGAAPSAPTGYFGTQAAPSAAARVAVPPTPTRKPRKRRSGYVMLYVPMMAPRDVIEEMLEKCEDDD